MSKTRSPSSESKIRPSPQKRNRFDSQKFLGVSLSGGRSDRTALTLIEYYPKKDRVFCSRVFDRISNEKMESSDSRLLSLIKQTWSEDVVEMGIDAPLSLPTCVVCRLVCPGNEICREKPILWMRKHRKKNKPLQTYTERPVDQWLALAHPEQVEIHQSLGSNLAPLAARAIYLSRQLGQQFDHVEVSSRLSSYRLAVALKIPKKHWQRFRNAIGGEEARSALLQALVEKRGYFIYQQDLRILREDLHAFESFVAAIIVFEKSRNNVDLPPPQFPHPESWVFYLRAE